MDTRIKQLAEDATRDHIFPGCAVGYIRDNETKVIPVGGLTYAADSPAVKVDTVYDVASITKSIPTSCLVLNLVERGLLSLDEKVINYIPELQNKYRSKILIRHLLTYTVVFDLSQGLSGIAKDSPDQIFETVFSAPLKFEPGSRYVYTSAPALLMGIILERIENKALNDVANEMFGPLPMPRTSFSTGWVDPQDVAPTEIDYRGTVRGVPHDEAAWALRRAGRIAGHAGLFSTAPDMLTFAQMLLNGGEFAGRRYLSPSTVEMMYTNQTPKLDHSIGLGWDIDWPEVFGTHASAKTFGRTGFTGTVLAIDPEKQRAIVLLSNRTYPHRPASRDAIDRVRRQLCDLVFAD